MLLPEVLDGPVHVVHVAGRNVSHGVGLDGPFFLVSDGFLSTPSSRFDVINQLAVAEPGGLRGVRTQGKSHRPIGVGRKSRAGTGFDQTKPAGRPLCGGH